MQKLESKQIILANDLAGLGKVALSNQIPIMACAGIEASILPTVILSSHTGGFENIQIDDYTSGMQGFLKQWHSLELSFNAILTGYLKNQKQIDILLNFKNNKMTMDSLLIVDPVMADNGKFYTGFDKTYAEKMKLLCQNADYIMPNITEACLLTDSESILQKPYSKNDVAKLIDKLMNLGSKNVIITGISFDDNNLAVAYFDKKYNKIDYVFTKKLKQKFFGTGDLFTAIVSACIINNIDLNLAIEFAVNWLAKCLNYTVSLDRDLKFGVAYESFLDNFILIMEELKRTTKNL